jgi:DNA-binding CsgD family transcriptional regulator
MDLMDVAKAHQLSIARRKGEGEFVETPDLKQAKQEIEKLRGATHILSKPFPSHERLTPRERVALSQIITGASSKEAGRSLGVSPRTVEFHRANIMQKLGAKNTVDLMRKVLAENAPDHTESMLTPLNVEAAPRRYNHTNACDGDRGRARAEKPVAVTRAEGTANRSSPCPKCRTEKIQKLTPVMVE